MKGYAGPFALSTQIVFGEKDDILEALHKALNMSARSEVPEDRVLVIDLNGGCYIMLDMLYVMLALNLN